MTSSAHRKRELTTRHRRSLVENVVRRLYTHLQPSDTLYTPITDPRFYCIYYPILSDDPIEERLYDDVGAIPDVLIKRQNTDDILIFGYSSDDNVEILSDRLKHGVSHRGKRVVTTLPAYTKYADRAVAEATDRPEPPSWFLSVAESSGGTRWEAADTGDIPVVIPRKIRSYYDTAVNGTSRKRYVFHKPSRYYG